MVAPALRSDHASRAQAHPTRLARIVAEHLSCRVDDLHDGARFESIGVGADSLDSIEIAMACEEEFGIEVPDEEVRGLATFGEAASYLESRLAGMVKEAAE